MSTVGIVNKNEERMRHSEGVFPEVGWSLHSDNNSFEGYPDPEKLWKVILRWIDWLVILCTYGFYNSLRKVPIYTYVYVCV